LLGIQSPLCRGIKAAKQGLKSFVHCEFLETLSDLALRLKETGNELAHAMSVAPGRGDVNPGGY
jgi:hypothetical protein